VAVVFALAACNTTSDRRDLYSPDKPQGPATAELRDWTLFGNNNHQSTTSTVAVASTAPVPPAGPIAPPPPMPESGTPDTSLGAPAATPMPGVPPIPRRIIRPVATPAPQPSSSDAIPVATPADAGGGGGGDIPGLSQ